MATPLYIIVTNPLGDEIPTSPSDTPHVKCQMTEYLADICLTPDRIPTLISDISARVQLRHAVENCL
jgi:hypothetical protein